MSVTARRVHLAQRPVGLPDESTWSVRDTELEPIGEGEVLVEVSHVSLDPAMRGWLNDVRSYVPPVALDEVMRASGVGTVLESRHPDFSQGEAVTGLTGVADHAVLGGEHLTHVDLDVAAPATWLGALGMPGMTAWFGLFDVAAARPGDTVVVSGAAGAVGSVVGQLAKAHGCRVIGIAGGPDKCAWLTDELGFDAAIDYKQGPVHRGLRELAPEGIDVYFDNVGGEHLEAAIGAFNEFGRGALCGAISSYNATEPAPGPRNMGLMVGRKLSLRGFIVSDHADMRAEFIEKVTPLVTSGELVVRETVREGLDQAVPAFLDLLRGGNTGKMIVKLADDA